MAAGVVPYGSLVIDLVRLANQVFNALSDVRGKSKAAERLQTRIAITAQVAADAEAAVAHEAAREEACRAPLAALRGTLDDALAWLAEHRAAAEKARAGGFLGGAHAAAGAFLAEFRNPGEAEAVLDGFSARIDRSVGDLGLALGAAQLRTLDALVKRESKAAELFAGLSDGQKAVVEQLRTAEAACAASGERLEMASAQAAAQLRVTETLLRNVEMQQRAGFSSAAEAARAAAERDEAAAERDRLLAAQGAGIAAQGAGIVAQNAAIAAQNAAILDEQRRLRELLERGRAGDAAGAGAAPRTANIAWTALMPDAAAPAQRGVMGTVLKARWTRRGVDVAVKLLRGSELSPTEYAEAAGRLEREAQALRLASDGGANRFVVALFGVARGAPTPPWRERLGAQLALFESQGDGGGAAQAPAGELFGLVMAWQDGGTLAARLHGGAVRWAARTRTPERLLLLERVAEGVALLHSAAPTLVVHGDIKGENVLLTAEGEPRLSDFGLAEVKRAVATSAGSVSARATRSDHASGTYPYMAPEMYKRRGAAALTASPATDVYALATLAGEVLVGEPPWREFEEADRVLEPR